MMQKTEISFPPFHLDLVDGRLWHGQRAIHLRRKTFAVLHYLLQHPHRLVTREELFSALWPETTVVESALNNCLQEIRKALADTTRPPRFIETVRGRGYRLIAPITTTIPLIQSPQSAIQSQNSQADLSHRRPTPTLVGREVELARLEAQLEKALNGQRQFVFVAGEPGIGKTTLVDTFVAHTIDHQDICIAHGQCTESYGVGEAYMPVLEALERLCLESNHARIHSLLRRCAPLWLLQMPMFLNRKERAALQEEVRGATRERMLREMMVFLEAFTTETPLVLCLEDLHWSDPSSLALLGSLAQRREPARLLVIGTYRPIEILVNAHLLRSLQQELLGKRLCTELALGGLSEGAVAKYLTVKFPQWRQQAVSLQQLAHLLHQRTEGNPLALVTVVEDLLERGLIMQVEEAWTLQGEPSVMLTDIPHGLQKLIEKQMDRLSPEQRHLLEAASLVGAEFSAVAVAAALGKDVQEVEERCAVLAERQQFLQPVERSVWPDGVVTARYAFRHALSQEVWYRRITPERQRQLHQRIGERLEAAYEGQIGEIVAELALHFERGRDFRRAVQYYERAAELAIQRHANQEAITHLTKALELLLMLPDTPERAQHELKLQFTLRVQIGQLKGEASSQLVKIVTRVRELSQQVEQTPQLFWALAGVYLFYLVREELYTARTFAEQRLLFSAPPESEQKTCQGYRYCCGSKSNICGSRSV